MAPKFIRELISREGRRNVREQAFDPEPSQGRCETFPAMKILVLYDSQLRQSMGQAGRTQVVTQFDYRLVARQRVAILSERLGLV